MSVSSSSRIIRQTSIYSLLVVTNVALTLGLLKVFPQLLPDNRSQVAPHTLVLPDNKQHPNFVTAAVDKVGEAVVRIDIERTVRTNVEIPFFKNPFFRDFFGEGLLPRIPKEYQQLEQGSGFIIDLSVTPLELQEATN